MADSPHGYTSPHYYGRPTSVQAVHAVLNAPQRKEGAGGRTTQTTGSRKGH